MNITAGDLAALLLTLPHNLEVCVPDTANNQTTSDIRVSVDQVYGVDCVIIEPVDEEDDDDDDR